METKLDPDQKKAVEHSEGPALVVAGPGSGKTTVIKERILHLVRKHKVDPEHILAIAFTNAAADEMWKRLSSEPVLKDSKPKICTLHVFGKDLIKAHYKQAGLVHEPNNIWDDKEIAKIINKEKSRLKRENEDKPVAIYKIEDKTTHQCYIGQTRKPERRRDEHFNDSSNRRLREAIRQKGREAFDFTYEWVAGIEADREEAYRIDSYRRRAAVNLNKAHKQVEKENSNIPIMLYKIKSPTTVTCYFGQTTDLQSIDKPEGFEVIGKEETWNQASKRIESEIENHKSWAVFNDEDPLHARDSTRRRIEVFCEYFKVPYDEVLKHTQKFEHEMRIFDRMNEDIVKEKSKVYTKRFKPEEISDPVLRAFAKRYEDRKTEAKAIDFLDMLILSANMLEKNQNILHEYLEKYRYIFIDEFQDISLVDFRLIKLFFKNLFAVGDDDQAIYGFRGGDSEIMQNFGAREDVAKYEITCNYRSTSILVRHAKALIEHNLQRISKNLRAEKSARSRVKILETSRDFVKNTLLEELFPIVTTCETHCKKNTLSLNNFLLRELIIPQKIGILARNWYEVNPIQFYLDSALKNKGFQVYWSDSDDQEKRKLIIRRGQKEIEISTIHSAKGREWEKVILLVNTANSRKPSLPDERNDSEDERRLFYVAITRPKQELVILDGGNCQFISEFQNVPLTREDIEEAFREELAARKPKLKIEFEEASKAALATLESRREKEVEKASKAASKQYDLGFKRLGLATTEHKNETKKMKEALPQQIKSANDTFLQGLIPVLDGFESQINSLPATVESNNESAGFVEFTKNIRRAQEQLLDLLKHRDLKPIKTSRGMIFNPVYHEAVSPAIYSDGVPADRIVREEQHGYLLSGRVIRKARVVTSKRKQRADVFLCQDFVQPVRFVTYTGLRDLTNIETFKDSVIGLDSQDKEVQLQNRKVLFAFPKEDMEALKPYIKRWLVIANRNLQPRSLTSERFRVADDILKQLLIEQDAIETDIQKPTVRVTARSGHVLNGHLWNFDEEFLYMKINSKDVIVYRSGLLRFVNLIWNEITKAYEDGDPIDGYVTKRIRDGFQVKFQSLIGFLPTSEVELYSAQHLDSYIGKTYEMKVIEVNEANNHFVLSRRAWLKEQNTELFKSLSEVSEEPLKLRNIKRVSKAVEAILETNQSPHIPEAELIPLGKLISMIAPEPVAEVIDTSPPISTEIIENPNTYIIDFKPETRKTVAVRGNPLYEPIDLIVPEPVKEVVDNRLPIPKGFLETPNSHIPNATPETFEIEVDPQLPKAPNSNAHLTFQECEDLLKKQIQDLKPEILEPSIVPDPPIALDNRAQETPQGHEDILKEQVQDLKPDTSEPKNPNNITQQPTLETRVDRGTPAESTALSCSDSSAEIDSDTHQIHGQNSSENEVEDAKKRLRYYLRRGGRFAVEKIKTAIFKKPNS